MISGPLGVCEAHDPTSQPPMPLKLEKLGRFLLRGLRIGASTIAIVELLRSDWNAGISASLAWLVFLLVERQLPPPEEDSGT